MGAVNGLLHTLVAAVQEKTAALSPETDAQHFLAALEDAWVAASARKLITVAHGSGDVSLQFRTVLGATLRDLLTHAFAPAGKHPVHRVAVFDARGRIAQVVSQSDVVRLLDEHRGALGALGATTLAQAGYLHAVAVVPGSYAATSAFHVMHTKHVASVAVVDDSGRAVKNLSASDLRGIAGRDHLKRLLEPVAAFAPDRPLVTLPPDATVATAVHTLAHHRLHHVFIVDDRHHAVGVVSLSDVLRSVQQALEKEDLAGAPA